MPVQIALIMVFRVRYLIYNGGKMIRDDFEILDDGKDITFTIDGNVCVVPWKIMRELNIYHDIDIAIGYVYSSILSVFGDKVYQYKDEINNKLKNVKMVVKNEN